MTITQQVVHTIIYSSISDYFNVSILTLTHYPVDLRREPPLCLLGLLPLRQPTRTQRLEGETGLHNHVFTPHAGEAGDKKHLAATFLCAEHINHGIILRKTVSMQYLYYLEQIGLAMSPLSNAKLFIEYHSNPFPQFFARGLNVSCLRMIP